MKRSQFNILLILMTFTFTCADTKKEEEFRRLDIWEDIRKAAKENRITYLIDISKDTLECIECYIGNNLIPKEMFFKNYLHQIEVSESKKYSFEAENYTAEEGYSKRYRINYAYGGIGKVENHNSIYTILKGEKGVQFQGVVSIP